MRPSKALGKCIFIITIMMVLFACNEPYSQNPSITNTPIDTSLFATPLGQTPAISMSDVANFGTSTAIALTGTPFTAATQTQTPIVENTVTLPATTTPSPISLLPTGGDTFALEATAIHNLPKAGYLYIAPVSLRLNETFLVELHMSRSRTEPELSAQIITANALATSTLDAGTLIAPEGPAVMLSGGQVEVTPFMQAKLFSEVIGAFEIQPLHDNSIQLLDPSTTVKWQWLIQAKKDGVQSLIFVIYQQAKTNDEAHWHTLETEKRVVQVNVTINQRLGALDWQWIAGTLITLIAIPALWRWYDQRQKKSKLTESSRYKRSKSFRNSTQESLLARLPRNSMGEGADSVNLGHIFISYRRSDSADIAGRIYDRLVEEFGPNPIFKDVDSIPLGTDFKKYLDKKVSECKILLAIIGDRWVDASDAMGKRRLDDHADFVRVEIESALKREIPVIPLLVRGAQMPVEENLPYSLRRLVFKNGIQIRPDPDFHRDMDRLISALYDYMG